MALSTINLRINELSVPGYERVVEFIHEESRLHAIIAIHSTVLGPALGASVCILMEQLTKPSQMCSALQKG